MHNSRKMRAAGVKIAAVVNMSVEDKERSVCISESRVCNRVVPIGVAGSKAMGARK